jgi:hypothetical protein
MAGTSPLDEPGYDGEGSLNGTNISLSFAGDLDRPYCVAQGGYEPNIDSAPDSF